MEVTNHLLKRSSLTGPRSRGHDLKDPSMFLITDPPRWSKGRPLTHVANDLMIVWKSPSPDSWHQTKFLKENKSCIALKKCLKRQIYRNCILTKHMPGMKIAFLWVRFFWEIRYCFNYFRGWQHLPCHRNRDSWDMHLLIYIAGPGIQDHIYGLV